MISQVVVLAAVVVAVLANPPLEYHGHAQPYKFGYSVKDHHGEQHREESGTGGHVTGSYGFTDARGIHRQVNYVADHGGFRAEVKTNEPGTANQNPAAVHLVSSAPAFGHLYGGLGGYGYGGYGGAYAGHGNGYAGHGHGYAGHEHGYAEHGHGYAGYGHGYAGHGGYGLGYGGLGYNGAGYGGYGLASALLGTLPYARYGY